jgi:hypothetical protein
MILISADYRIVRRAQKFSLYVTVVSIIAEFVLERTKEPSTITLSEPFRLDSCWDYAETREESNHPEWTSDHDLPKTFKKILDAVIREGRPAPTVPVTPPGIRITYHSGSERKFLDFSINE